MRNPSKADDIPVLAAWLLWELFVADDEGAGDAQPSDDGTPKKRDPKPPPSPRSSGR